MIIILYSSASHSSTPEEVKVSSRRAYYYYDDDDDDIFDGDGRTTTDILSSYHTGVFITSLFVRLAGGVLGGIVFFFSEFKTSEKRTVFSYCCAVVVSPQRCYSVDVPGGAVCTWLTRWL